MASRSVAVKSPSALIARQPLLLRTNGSGAILTRASSERMAATDFITASRLPPQVSQRICTKACKHTSSTSSRTSPFFTTCCGGGGCFFDPRSQRDNCCRNTEMTPAMAVCCGLSNFRRAASLNFELMLSRRTKYSISSSCEDILLPSTFRVCSASSMIFMLLVLGSWITFLASAASAGVSWMSSGSSSGGCGSLQKLGSCRA
mmetsp:Transcript_50529/g.120475  ORF Transcript_50529/g.120475 Transcript_50529/m.120475 type:complete len:203 (+) Transcript_50529:529-1137(+)